MPKSKEMPSASMPKSKEMPSAEMSESKEMPSAEKLVVKKEKKIKEPKEPKEKKPRAYSFIQAFAEWRKEKNWSGLCPKKGTEEYDEIRKIYEEHRA
jgi:hypothetical protein